MPAPQSTDHELLQLAEAFDTFNLVSTQLEASYSSLESRIAEMRRQLRAADALRRAETHSKQRLADRMRSVLEALPGAVVVLDGEGSVTDCNTAAREWLPGLDKGVRWSSLSESAFAAELSEQGDLVLRDGRHLTLTKRSLGAGRERILLFMDVTEQRRLDEVLARHRRLAMLGEMVATVAHQIRTPVTSALLYSSTAMQPGIDAAKRAGFIEKSIACLSDLEALIKDMLMFAGGYAATAESKVAVADVLRRVEDAVRPLVTADQALSVAIPKGEVFVRGNAEALASAIQNLVVNALQMSGPSASVWLSAAVEQAASGQLLIRIADNGPGIAEPDIERVFEPFFSRRANGTGLGLAVARSIVRAHQGDLTAANGTRGGAVFSVRLPLLADHALEAHR
jgi:two-component system sensor histidine kinase FlrB